MLVSMPKIKETCLICFVQDTTSSSSPSAMLDAYIMVFITKVYRSDSCTQTNNRNESRHYKNKCELFLPNICKS